MEIHFWLIFHKNQTKKNPHDRIEMFPMGAFECPLLISQQMRMSCAYFSLAIHLSIGNLCPNGWIHYGNFIYYDWNFMYFSFHFSKNIKKNHLHNHNRIYAHIHEYFVPCYVAYILRHSVFLFFCVVAWNCRVRDGQVKYTEGTREIRACSESKFLPFSCCCLNCTATLCVYMNVCDCVGVCAREILRRYGTADTVSSSHSLDVVRGARFMLAHIRAHMQTPAPPAHTSSWGYSCARRKQCTENDFPSIQQQPTHTQTYMYNIQS